MHCPEEFVKFYLDFYIPRDAGRTIIKKKDLQRASLFSGCFCVVSNALPEVYRNILIILPFRELRACRRQP